MAKAIEKTELTEVSEAQIAVHWKEEEYYQPSEKFKAQANMRDPHVFEKFGSTKFRNASENNPISRPGSSHITTASIPATRRSGNCSSVGRSIRPTTCLTVM